MGDETERGKRAALRVIIERIEIIPRPAIAANSAFHFGFANAHAAILKLATDMLSKLTPVEGKPKRPKPPESYL